MVIVHIKLNYNYNKWLVPKSNIIGREGEGESERESERSKKKQQINDSLVVIYY